MLGYNGTAVGIHEKDGHGNISLGRERGQAVYHMLRTKTPLDARLDAKALRHAMLDIMLMPAVIIHHADLTILILGAIPTAV